MADKTIDISRLPVTSGEHKFLSWDIKYSQSHILHSKCSNAVDCSTDTTKEKCSFCTFSEKLKMPHLPDMVFPNNTLSLKHESGCTISFNALDALESVVDGQLPLEISCADAWKESRMDSGHMDKIKPFDWTFSSTYSGTVKGNFNVVETDQRIDLDKLRQKEQILYYQDLTLFEDELHDNGIAVSNVKIRVMPSGFFILLRYFLRVDNVLVKINDTRFYHEFETDFFLREYTSKEAKASDLNVPLAVLNEPSEVAEILPIVKSCFEKFTLPAVNKPDEASAQEIKATE